MSSLVIFHIEPGPFFEGGDDIVYTCRGRCSGMAPEDVDLYFSAQVDPTALATTINAAIVAAGVAEAAVAGYTVGILDKKTIIGGALGL